MRAPICFVVGARPNFVKTAPVLRALQSSAPEHELLLVHTGQHYEPNMSAAFVRDLSLPEPDVHLGVGSGTHAEQTARVLVGVEGVLAERRPELVVVSGDVNSTLAAALAAVKLDIPVAHVEAGLRSFDRQMPEEHNRRLTDHLSSLLLVHSDEATANLAAEGIGPEGVHLVGNTMIDSLLEHLEAALAAEPWSRFGVDRDGYGLVTLHRPALVDSERLTGTVTALLRLADRVPLVFPLHPRTAGRLDELGLGDRLATSRLTTTPPLGYLEFLGLEAGARFVVTDSGGVQEETSALGVPCFTLRDSTERPVTLRLGTNTLLGLEPGRLAEIPDLVADAPSERPPIPLWDGSAGPRAARAIVDFVARDGLG